MEDNEKEEKEQELKNQDMQEQEVQKEEGQGSNQEQQESKQEQQDAEEDLNLDDVIPKKQIKITLTTGMIILIGICMVVILAIILIVGNSRREDSVYYEDYDGVDYFDVDDCDDDNEYNGHLYTTSVDKPIIYIYPIEETKVTVKLGKPENLAVSYPKYKEEGWKVLAKTDGTLIDSNSGRNLYALYWEGKKIEKRANNVKEGFVVEGENTAKFLEEKLAILGLNEREAEEFIVYWLPQMENNKFNYIRFESLEEIEEIMPLEINPKPDTLIRIMMEWEPLDEKIEIEEQKLEKAERDGYTVVEWGGTKLK